MEELKDLIQVVSGLLAPCIAVTVAYIARQQYKVNSLRLKHELFDRRMQLYYAVRDLRFKLVSSPGRFTDEDLTSFQIMIQPANFLLSEPAAVFLRVCEERAREYLDREDAIKELDLGEQLQAFQQQNRETRQWFRTLNQELDTAFRSDLELHYR